MTRAPAALGVELWEIRALSPAEAPLFHRWLMQALPRCFPDFPREAMAFYLAAWTEERLKKESAMHVVAWQEGAPAGACLGTGVEGGVGMIVWLFVDTPSQGSGLGGALFRAAADQYRALGAHKVKLTAHNEAAVAFYHTVGMKTEGFHPRHWWGMDFHSLGYEL